MPPFCFAVTLPSIGASALETRGANVFGSQLQVTQRAQKAAAPLAASLKCFLRVKETRRLLRHRGHYIRFGPRNRPDSNLQPLGAVGTGLPSTGHLCRSNQAAAVGTSNGARRSLREAHGCIRCEAGRFRTARNMTEQVEVQTHT